MRAPPIIAVVPVKDTRQAKQRLAGVLSPARRQELALATLQDVLTTLAAAVATAELGGILTVTADPAAAALATRYGADVSGERAAEGHTGAVAAAARRLAADGRDLLTLPADIPLVEPADIRALIAARACRGFTIVPARDERGSNAILCSPADAVPLRFGADSFFPHLAAARACEIEPNVLRLPRIALDIDTPDDLRLLLQSPARTRAGALLDRWRPHDRIKASA